MILGGIVLLLNALWCPLVCFTIPVPVYLVSVIIMIIPNLLVGLYLIFSAIGKGGYGGE